MSALTNLMPQHAFQPELPGRANIDGEFGFAVDHRQRGSGQQVISQPHQDLDHADTNQSGISVSEVPRLLSELCLSCQPRKNKTLQCQKRNRE